MRFGGLVLGALLISATSSAAAQEATSTDTRTQYPVFLANSYFGFGVGSMGHLFSGQQLEPGFQAQSVDVPRLAVRVDLFGHRFFKHFSAQISYMRPARFVAYRSVNGETGTRKVSNAYAGLTLTADLPLTARLSAYGEGGFGLTSRSGFEIDGKTAMERAHYGAGLLGAGFMYRATPNTDFVLGATYSPGRKSFKQPSTRLFTAGLRYHMRPLPAAKVEDNRRAGFVFPANLVRVGYTTNALHYGVNNLFSSKIPIFWGGNVETRQGVTLDYSRNVFHTKKRFAFDMGGSVSIWKSNRDGEPFLTLSTYPLFRFFLLRRATADVYFNYSLAGPTYVNIDVIDGSDTGEVFTFQDFMGVGMFFGKTRRINAELGIKHFSNGNIFTKNASIKVPLTLTLGVTF
jgi:hypothetical protein